MDLLVESEAPLTAKPQIVEKESAEHGGRLILRGPAQRLGIKNANDRVYPRTVFENNLQEGSRFRDLMQERKVLGELEHPESGNTHLSRVSHVVLDADIDELKEDNDYGVPAGTYVLTECMVLNTPNGRILRELAEAGVPVGSSSRGRGDTENKDGANIVQDNYELDCWDYVYRPSVDEAYHTPVTEAEGDFPGDPGPEDAAAPPEDAPVGPPPGQGPPEDDSAADISAASDLIDKYADLMKSDDLASMCETIHKAVDALDNLRSDTSDEAIRLSAQLVLLIKGLVGKVESETGVEDSSEESDSETSPPKNTSSKEKEDSESSEPEPEEDKEEEEESEEQQGADWIFENLDQLEEEYRNEITSLMETFDKKDEDNKGSLVEDGEEETGEESMEEKCLDKEQKKKTKKKKKKKDQEEQKEDEEPLNGVVFFRQMLEKYAALTEENKKLKEFVEQHEDSIPKDHYESAVKMAASLTRKARGIAKQLEAANAIIGDLRERYTRLDFRSFVFETVVKHKELREHVKSLLECESKEEVLDKVKSIKQEIKEAKERDERTHRDLMERTTLPKVKIPGETEQADPEQLNEDEEEKETEPADLMEAMEGQGLW